MSYRTEWFDAARTGVEILPQDTEVPGCDEPVTGEVAVHFAGDTGAIIEGPRERVRALLAAALAALDTTT
ncbi:hypothetical protein [Dietzia sp. 179-F 9C3 NHS]|uniref:hypothetical protein n=1 Tax=Dietzia sp. 179-F 9C3 NHS TaxID=3374295 RepID=UPI003879F83C